MALGGAWNGAGGLALFLARSVGLGFSWGATLALGMAHGRWSLGLQRDSSRVAAARPF